MVKVLHRQRDIRWAKAQEVEINPWVTGISLIVWNFWCHSNPYHSETNYREKALRPLFQGFVSFFLSLFALAWISSSSLSVKNLAKESLRVSIWVEKIDDLKILNSRINRMIDLIQNIIFTCGLSLILSKKSLKISKL